MTAIRFRIRLVLIMTVVLSALPTVPSAKDWSPADCSKVGTRELSREAINLFLSGKYFSVGSRCLDQRRFKYFLSKPEPPGDGPGDIPEVWLSDDFSVTILKETKGEVGDVTVHFKLVDQGRTFKDSLTYLILRTSNVSGLGTPLDSECAQILSHPKMGYMPASCRK